MRRIFLANVIIVFFFFAFFAFLLLLLLLLLASVLLWRRRPSFVFMALLPPISIHIISISFKCNRAITSQTMLRTPSC